jgi:hypothetical protein
MRRLLYLEYGDSGIVLDSKILLGSPVQSGVALRLPPHSKCVFSSLLGFGYGGRFGRRRRRGLGRRRRFLLIEFVYSFGQLNHRFLLPR